MREIITEMVEKQMRGLVAEHLAGPTDTWDAEAFVKEVKTIFPNLPEELADPEAIYEMDSPEVEEILVDEVARVHDQRVEEFGPEVMAVIERHVLLRHIDAHWVDHLTAIENMRQGIGLEAIGQRDPLVQYKRTAYQMFEELMSNIEHDISHTIYRVAPAQRLAQSHREAPATAGRGTEPGAAGSAASAGASTSAALMNRKSVMAGVAAGHGSDAAAGRRKIGRNDPCFCGSGKKFKRCHGAS